ncbi:MAG: epoxyqueuosine reductase QueH, partial [Candidatus Cloacimonadaceae bacterium]|nr:epoxyqueuosine reductase QueH [Candidatus Cloacimonadaceae bacterium]
MSEPEKLFIHTCCAPCLVAPYHHLRNEGIQMGIFWYNLNIHPYMEYKLRLLSLQDFAEREGFEIIMRDEYGLLEFLKNAEDETPGRCRFCYDSRLDLTAKTAVELGYDAFTSTLLYSKFQNHELLVEVAHAKAEKYGIPFYYRDWRKLWSEGVTLSKIENMHRQKYCGCIYSERDRYLGKKK